MKRIGQRWSLDVTIDHNALWDSSEENTSVTNVFERNKLEAHVKPTMWPEY